MEDNDLVTMIIKDLFNSIGTEDEENKDVAQKQEGSKRIRNDSKEGKNSAGTDLDCHNKTENQQESSYLNPSCAVFENNMENLWKNTDKMLEDTMLGYNMLEDHMLEDIIIEDIWKNMDSLLEDNMDIWNHTSDILSRTEAVLAEFTK